MRPEEVRSRPEEVRSRPEEVRSRLSAVVMAQNSAETIARCVHSLAFADEVIVVDGGSEDDTARLAAAAGARVIVNAWPGFSEQRRFALEEARGEWVLACDSDEEVTPALAREIEAAIASPGEARGFWLPRKNTFLGRWMKHGPWSRDRVLRLFRRDRVSVTDRRVHEGYLVDGETRSLANPLHHHTHPTIAASVERMNRYTSLEARDRVGRRRVGVIDAVVPPIGVFVKYYLVRGCWRDGTHGLVLSAITAIYKSVLYVKTYLLQRSTAARH